uniref:RAB6-interacting golgin n=2 Tax=Aegilops tauschii subsp. strangulata TaxID=200361 RepID=A0A452Y8M5_AEGTS
ALEHLRKKIEMSTERIRLAKVKEDEAKKAWEAAAQVVKEEEEAKQRLCDDLNRLVQESAASQYSRLEELKKRLECLNPIRASVDVSAATNSVPQQPTSQNLANAIAPASNIHKPATSGSQQQRTAEAERKQRSSNSGGRGRGGVMVLPKGRGSSGSGWTGAGFET